MEFKFEGEDPPPYTMEDLKKDRPEYGTLVEEFYALENEVDLLSPEIVTKYNSLYEDPNNIIDIIDRKGVEEYRSIMNEIRKATIERGALINEIKEKVASFGKELLEVYCRLKESQLLDFNESQRLNNLRDELPAESELCRSGVIKGEALENIPVQTLKEINRELDNDINETEIKKFIDQEEVLREKKEKISKIYDKKRAIAERANIIMELSERLEVSREIAKRMGLREITNANSLNNLSSEELESLRNKRRELLKLGESYGGIDLYDRQDVEALIEELFRDIK